jgi:hypothetical protein
LLLIGRGLLIAILLRRDQIAWCDEGGGQETR